MNPAPAPRKPAPVPKEAPADLLAPAKPAPAAEPAAAPADKPKTAAQIQADKAKKLSAYLDKYRKAMVSVIPATMKPERLIKLAISAYNNSPLLAQCDFTSIALSLMHAAELGLEPNTALGHCYLIPRRNGKTGRYQCHFLLGYRGMIELSRRSGEIESIEANVVKEGDTFEAEYGCNKHLTHRPSYIGAPGNPIAFYAIAKMKGGGFQFEVMSKAEIDAIKARADEQTHRKSSPWDTDYIEMARKTVVRRLFKYLPVSVEAQRGLSAAIAIGDQEDAGQGEDLLDALELEKLAAGSDIPALPEATASDTAAAEMERGIMPEQATDRFAEALTV